MSHTNRIQRRGTVALKLSPNFFNMHEWSWVSWIFCPASSLMTQQNKLSHNCLLQELFLLSCVCFYLVSGESFHMPRSLAQEKAYQVEQQRLRTERRIAQLKEEAYQNEIVECKTLFALLWISVIVWFYARLYLGSSE